MHLKDNLKRLLKEKDINVSQLSKRTEVPIQTLHNWLSGVEPRSLKQVRKVSKYFGVSLDFLCFGVKAESDRHILREYDEEIRAGVYEVVLRRVQK